jgi:hypothetical protein
MMAAQVVVRAVSAVRKGPFDSACTHPQGGTLEAVA